MCAQLVLIRHGRQGRDGLRESVVNGGPFESAGDDERQHEQGDLGERVSHGSAKRQVGGALIADHFRRIALDYPPVSGPRNQALTLERPAAAAECRLLRPRVKSAIDPLRTFLRGQWLFAPAPIADLGGPPGSGHSRCRAARWRVAFRRDRQRVSFALGATFPSQEHHGNILGYGLAGLCAGA